MIRAKHRSRMLLLAAGMAVLGLAATKARAEIRLETVFSSDLVIYGVTTGIDERLFLPVRPQGPGNGPQMVAVTAVRL